ncbi:MAG: HAMP domain-containing histidine kinase [Holosporaceae bacterium]|jgi:signal transduction histidine kinase|nr:HAMP domain-containing histidine kinase [Holosporaceae bacterium]
MDEKIAKKVERLERFKTLAEQAAHDIRTPLQSLSIALDYRFKSLPEEEYVLLRSITDSIRKIALALLEHSPAVEDRDNVTSKKVIPTDLRHILIPQALAEIVKQKELQYAGQNVEFKYSFDPSLRSTFIYGSVINIERMMSNIINNSVEAFEGKSGVVKIGLMIENDNVKIVVEDNGKGMPPEMVEKLLLGESVPTTKKNGYGIGTQQVRDALAEFNGAQLIQSTVDVGTVITLIIPKSDPQKGKSRRSLSPNTVMLNGSKL